MTTKLLAALVCAAIVIMPVVAGSLDNCGTRASMDKSPISPHCISQYKNFLPFVWARGDSCRHEFKTEGYSDPRDIAAMLGTANPRRRFSTETLLLNESPILSPTPTGLTPASLRNRWHRRLPHGDLGFLKHRATATLKAAGPKRQF